MYEMYETIQRLYQRGQLTEKGVSNAMLRGWITQEQANAIVAGKAG